MEMGGEASDLSHFKVTASAQTLKRGTQINNCLLLNFQRLGAVRSGRYQPNEADR
jgi:hypothetical protein